MNHSNIIINKSVKQFTQLQSTFSTQKLASSSPTTTASSTIPQCHSEQEKIDKIIVVSRFNEDVSWLAIHFPHIKHVVYEKQDLTAPYHVEKNYGQEASAFLRYIIDHYDKLPNYMAFVHAHRSSWHIKDIVPILKHLYWGKYEYVSLNPDKFTYHSAGNQNYDRVKKYWSHLFEESFGKMPPVIYNWCCASFVVSRERVLRNSKSFYEKIYHWIMNSGVDSFWTSRVLEHTWGFIFHHGNLEKNPISSLCDITDCLAFNGTSN
ncbi:hypothetical protein C9374_011407 [Naegleria lovaniensis]|uniref:Uncharacterized protein n=1 Tax=Naegleria lovaniensis TaxID=51637 RepID=A0AA88H490_NAELO|nr:uncharacterized protein C9374_011407 [Naegleria lovaniensis]KAG2392682.1 hypothetical protein C9374_011407 [Naegleria lovaniensis]